MLARFALGLTLLLVAGACDQSPVAVAPPPAVASAPVALSHGTALVLPKVDVGNDHACAVAPSSKLICWGFNGWGQASPPSGTFLEVAAGGQHSCGIRTDHTLACWGANTSGETNAPAGTFVQLDAATEETPSLGGHIHNCAVKTDGTVACWGSNANNKATPPVGVTFLMVEVGLSGSCGLRNNGATAGTGSIQCWGAGITLGIPAGSTWKQIAVGSSHGCALSAAGLADCWGSNSFGQLGIEGANVYTQVAAGSRHSCGILASDHTIICAGYNGDGELNAPGGGGWQRISAGSFSSCAVNQNGQAACWGNPVNSAAAFNQVPNADAGADQSISCNCFSGTHVTLNGSGSSDQDGTIASYQWLEGATQIASGVTPDVVLAPGTHTITLVVTDNAGDTDQDQVVVTVNHVNQPPTANAGPDQSIGCNCPSGTDVALDGSGSTDADGTIASYKWFEGATQIATGAQPTVHFATGSHTVRLEVTDNSSATDDDEVMITVSHLNQAPTAAISGPTSGNEGASLTFSGSGSSDPEGAALTYTWTFGDGSPAESGPAATHQSRSHTYADNGSYTVTLVVNDGTSNSAPATQGVAVANVAPNVAALSGASLGAGGTYQENGSFTDPGADTWNATVSYGDGSGTNPLALKPDKTFHLQHVYSTGGHYTVTVTVTDDDGGSDSESAAVSVNTPPHAAIAPASGNEGSPITLDGRGSSDADGDALTYAWDLDNDGSFETSGAVASRTYADNGSYTVRLRVSDGQASDIATAQVAVANVAPDPSPFAGGTIMRGETYTSSGSFTDPGADLWTATVNYGDGTGTQPLVLNPDKTFSLSHTYATAGTFTVTVVVSDDDGGSGSESASVHVRSAPEGTQDLIGQVSGLESAGRLSRGEANNLRASLDAALSAFARGNATAAANELGAFINKVEALKRSGRLDAATAQALIDATNRVLRSMGT